MSPKALPARRLESSPSLSHLRPDRGNSSSQSRDTSSSQTSPPFLQSTFSSLPNSYEIPSLRSRTQRSPVNESSEKHGRGTSHSLPGFFGGRKDKKQDLLGNDTYHTPGHDANVEVKTSQARRGLSGPKVKRKEDSQPSTGPCMTCASTVRWPQGLKAFRCTTCLTVNDLEPSSPQETSGDGSVHARKAMTISLDRTKKLIDRCLDNFLLHYIGSNRVAAARNNPAMQGDGTLGTQRQLQDSYTMVNSLPHRMSEKARTDATAHSASSPSLSNTSTSGQRVHPSDSSIQPQGGRADAMVAEESQNGRKESTAIFRDVESYISNCFSGCAALNASFLSVRSATGEFDRMVDHVRTPEHGASTRTMLHAERDTSLSNLDAKTLLLGDVAENGSWWTGRPMPRAEHAESARERSPEHSRGIVSAKSPRINWYELNEWYRIILGAGDDWYVRWQALSEKQANSSQRALVASPDEHLQLAINDSRLHLQRVLLKSTENLLKRPRRPLQNAEDSRFLLMLLANPLLHSSPQRPVYSRNQLTAQGTAKQNQELKSGAPIPLTVRRNLSSSERSGILGQHTGILKRIFGLLSNLPNNVHQLLVSWMSRFADSHFQRNVDIVSSFVTYRLSKQQNRSIQEPVHPTEGLVPTLSDTGEAHASQLHAALSNRSSGAGNKKANSKPKLGLYSEDWQVRAAARFMSLLFQANVGHTSRKRDLSITAEQRMQSAGLNAKYHAYSHGQILPISAFYNLLLDHADLVGDFEAWETTKSKFTFCQYPFFLSIWAKIRIMEHDARRQMEVKAREAFFDSILSNRAVSQFLVLKVRRDCLVDDSLRSVSQVVGSGTNDIKKGLRIDFVDEEGVDAGGLRKEWFLLLVREIFDPQHGLFLYDDDSGYCYFNPFCFESSEQFFLVGVLVGLAIYNSTILDIAFPPFVFRKMLASAPPTGDKLTSTPRMTHAYTLEDLAEYRPALAKGLRQLLDFEGDVQEVFCRDFVVEMDKYGEVVQIPLRPNGENKPVTNSNRREFVDLYVRHLLDTAVARQYEPFKRGFFSVCGGNALSLFQPEEIELLVRGSDERLDVASLRAVATYDNWPKEAGPPETQPQVLWFWQTFEQATPSDQRKLLSFITGSDRIPAMGTTNLTIRIQCIRDTETELSGREVVRFPIARTCFNTINLHRYLKRETLETKLWMAVRDSEGFGLK